MLKEHGNYTDYDVSSLFPTDEISKSIMANRTKAVEDKTALKIASEELFAQNKYISFNLNQDLYCIKLDYVKEVLKDTSITDIPGTG